MGLRGAIGRALARLGVRLAGDELFEASAAEVPVTQSFGLTAEGRAMRALGTRVPKSPEPAPEPLSGSAEDLRARGHGVRS